jgi:CheY-like chemotaxis protein
VGGQLADFGNTAKGLARNPLGIIALFIVMVYGFAALVTASASSFSSNERLPLIYFLVCFPVLVLAVFTWLVSKHPARLFGPGDFKNEENWVKMQLTAVASLVAASAKDPSGVQAPNVERIVTAVQEGAKRREPISDWRKSILWVDDRPENNRYERKAFEAIGLSFVLAQSTNDAFERLESQRFAAIISDMGRKEGPREGYVLLDRLRASGDRTPLFFYASSRSPEHVKETLQHGGQGCTNDPEELFEMVTKSVIGAVGSTS